MKQTHTNEVGFTLIELIIVIVILGIISISAAPRFINISSDANAQTIQALKAAMVDTNRLVYAKALIQGLTNEESANVVLSNGTNISIKYGYLSYERAALTGAENFMQAINFDICHHKASSSECADSDWLFDIDDDGIKFYNKSIGQDPTQNRGNGVEPLCYLKYSMSSAANTQPTYLTRTSEC